MAFELSEKEQKQADAFRLIHEECKNCSDGFIYSFKSSGIGKNAMIQCAGCKEFVDITDVEQW